MISRALAEGFRGSLGEGMQPAAWLWIDLEPSLVDVNVHPAKREVRFRRPLDLREAIFGSVIEALRPPPAPAPVASVEPVAPEKSGRPAVLEPVPAPVKSWSVVTKPIQQQLPVVSVNPVGSPRKEIEIPAPEEKSRFRVMALLHQRYVLLESAEGLVIFDPKAAKERIFYEKLLQQHEGGIVTQGLLVPVLIDLDPRDLDMVLREKAALADAGIEVEAFGGNTLQVSSLPASIPVNEPLKFLGELLDELLHESVPGKRFAFERMARLLAKRAAMPVSASLSEARPLLDELFRCELPYCAADGRPTLSEIGMKELVRRFSGSKG